MLMGWFRRSADTENAELRYMMLSGDPQSEARRLRQRFGMIGLEEAINLLAAGESKEDIESLLGCGVTAQEMAALRMGQYESFVSTLRTIADTGVTASEALNAWGIRTGPIGDASCQNNARSPWLRCAVNPCGPCEGCDSFEERAEAC